MYQSLRTVISSVLICVLLADCSGAATTLLPRSHGLFPYASSFAAARDALNATPRMFSRGNGFIAAGRNHAILAACPQPLGAEAQCSAIERVDLRAPEAPDSKPAGYYPSDLQAAYAAPSTAGAGVVVGIVSAYGYPQAASDLAVYRRKFKLPACTVASACLRIVSESGGVPPAKSSAGWDESQAVDVDTVSALCPKCKIVLVEARTNYNRDLYRAIVTAARLKAGVILSGFTGNEFEASAREFLAGHVYVAAAGNAGGGVKSGVPQQPCTFANVVCVGGTQLKKQTTSKRGWTETTWNDLADKSCSGSCGGTGSACSKLVPKPAWQTDKGCGMRSATDISADADVFTPVAVYSTPARGWSAFGGTGVAAGIVAGMYALAGGAAETASSIWSDTGKHANDITTGTNVYRPVTGPCASSVKYICRAGAGYDGPTGWGSPNGVGSLGTRLKITGIDNASPTALTSINLTTSGLNASNPVTVTFTDGAQWAVTGNPASVSAGGTIQMNVPQYISLSTGQSATASVSVSITQGSESSAPIAITIQDLPQLSDFGTTPGAITDGYYQYLELALGQQLDALQAVQSSPANTADTTPEQADVQQELQDVILARNDVDQIINSPSTVIPVETLSNGTPVQFDVNTVTQMDRVLGWHLVNAFSGIAYSPRTKHRPKRLRWHADVQSIQQIEAALKTNGGAATAVPSYQSAVAIGVAGAITGGIIGGLTLGVYAAAGLATAATFGTVMAIVVTGVFVAVAGASLIGIAANTGNQAVVSEYTADFKAAGTVAATTVAGDAIGGFATAAGAEGVGVGLMAAHDLLDGGDALYNAAFQSGHLGGDSVTSFKEAIYDQLTSIAIAKMMDAALSSFQFGEIYGTTTVSDGGSSQTPSLYLVSGTCPSYGGGTTPVGSGVADDTGSYEVFVSDTTVTSANCGGDMSLDTTDPVTTTLIATELFDATGVSPSNPLQAPTMSGTCNDPDRGSGDGDEPDCD